MTRVDIRQVILAVGEVAANKGLRDVPITEATSLAELGFDSLDLAEVLVILEEVVQGELDAGTAGILSCVGDLTKLAARGTGP